MIDLGDLLGQTELAVQLADALAEPEGAVVRLTGPAGSGKSYVARRVAQSWYDEGGACVIAVGDDDRSWRDLYPLLSGLAQTRSGWGGLAASGTRSTLGLADRALGVAGVGTSIFDLLGAAFRQRLDRLLKPYSGVERDVILDLKRLARNRKVLIVADNAHWWDADALRLLQDLLSARLREVIPQLASVAVLVVDTAEEQRIVAPEPFGSLTALCANRTHTLPRCTREQFPEVLEFFGVAELLPDEVSRALFGATDGHLKLAEQVAAYAALNSVETLATSTGEDYVATLVASRFASLGSFSPQVTDLLARAAIMGLSCTERDLLCLTDTQHSELQALLEQASRIGFIERHEQRVGFSHDVVRLAILGSCSSAGLAVMYAKLADCLAILRPGDYAARAQAKLQARADEGARDMVALAGVGELRRGVRASKVLRRAALQLPEDPALLTYLDKIGRAYASVGSGDFVSPIPSLRTPVPSESVLMAAERNYIAALCSMELQTASGVAEARIVLTGWIPSLVDEVELRLRFSLLLQQAQVLSQMFNEARATESDIERQLLRRVRHDPEAAVSLQIQNRRAGAVSSPEIAEERIQEAVAFFRQEDRGATRDELELFRALNNLAAGQLRLSKDADAYRHAREAEEIVLRSPDAIRRLDVLANNLVLAAYRSESIAISEAVTRQQLIVDSPEGSDDKFLHRCNLAAYLLLDSRDADADRVLQTLEDELRDREIDESYLLFFWSALSVASAAVRGEVAEAQRRHSQMDRLVASLNWPYAAYVRRRQLLLGDVLPRLRSVASRGDVDRALLAVRPVEVGPGWAYYARLMPCCGLSFWSDS